MGGPGPVLGTKETALGQLVVLCFNSDTMWQQWLRGQRRSIRLLIFCLTLLTGDYLRRLTLPLRKALGFPHCAQVQVCMRALGRGVDGRNGQGQGRKTFPSFLSRSLIVRLSPCLKKKKKSETQEFGSFLYR